MFGAVRHAVRADLNPLAAALADAFADDPMMAWIYPDPGTRPGHIQAFMRAALDIGFPHGHLYAAGATTAAAIWAPPDVDLFDDQLAARVQRPDRGEAQRRVRRSADVAGPAELTPRSAWFYRQTPTFELGIASVEPTIECSGPRVTRIVRLQASVVLAGPLLEAGGHS